ncbi:urease accessory UreF family protein [Nonomuraea sp. NPDC048916]|uniref:urease accessory protein UreF n=1 Tax=Nonomuraea sp. NPDC048916 TaxID=3154232 RepID=UPI0033C6E19A
MNPALLLLTDSRLPAGGHAHSGGAEQAVGCGAVHDLPSLSGFLRGRLRTSGRVAAALAAAACVHASRTASAPLDEQGGPQAAWAGLGEPGGAQAAWAGLDAEADARTASPAQRAASRTQGRLLLRVARRIWPSPAFDFLARAVPDPHHPVALGTAAYAAGASPGEAALAAAYHAVTGPATAAARLLGLDPVEVHRLLADLGPDLTEMTADPVTGLAPTPHGTAATGRRWADLPAHSAPALDLLAERHAAAEVRLFVS